MASEGVRRSVLQSAPCRSLFQPLSLYKLRSLLVQLNKTVCTPSKEVVPLSF